MTGAGDAPPAPASCASLLLLPEEAHPKLVQERLGHATIATALDTYSHVLPSMEGKTAEALEEVLGEEDPHGVGGTWRASSRGCPERRIGEDEVPVEESFLKGHPGGRRRDRGFVPEALKGGVEVKARRP